MKTCRLSLRALGVLAFVLVACGGGDSNVDDGGSDGAIPDGTGGKDVVAPDTGIDTGIDTGVMMDSGGGMDGTTESGADAADGGFDVGSISCVVLWLEASQKVTIVNNVVSAWGDNSSSNNNAAQGTANLRPAQVMNVINGHAVIRFDGNNNARELDIPDSMSLQWGTGDFLVEVVARFNNNPNGGMNTGVGTLYSKLNPNNLTGPVLLANNVLGGPSTGLSGGVGMGNFFGLTQPYNDNAARNYALQRVGTTLGLRVNGMNVATVLQNGNVDVSSTNVPVRIGADANGQTRRLNGDIAELIACKGAISAQDQSAIESYLKSKYNL